MAKEYTRALSVTSIIPSAFPVLFNVDFNEHISFEVVGGVGASCKRVVGVGLNKSVAGLLSTAVTAGQSSEARLFLSSFMGVSSRLRFEVVYNTPDIANINYLGFKVQYFSGAESVLYDLRYDKQNQIWQYLNSDENWDDISNGGQKIAGKTWNVFSFTFDVIGKRYISALSNNKEMNVYNLPSYSFVDLTTSRVVSFLYINSTLDHSGSCYIDHIVLSQA